MGSTRAPRVIRDAFGANAEVRRGGASNCTRGRGRSPHLRGASASGWISAASFNLPFAPITRRVTLCASTLLLAPLRHLSTFHSAKIKNQKRIIHQCLRASGGTPHKTLLKVNKGNRAQKNFEIFSGHFYGKTLANQRKNVKKTLQNNAKKLRFLTCFSQANFAVRRAPDSLDCGLRTVDSGLTSPFFAFQPASFSTTLAPCSTS